jgi:hypothetical protein
MTLSDLAALGSFISGVGVLISLIYLARQIRQNTMSHRATAYEAHHAFIRRQIDITLDPVLGPLRARVYANDETLTDGEYEQYIALQVAWFVGQDHLVWLRDNGILDQDAFDNETLALRAGLTEPPIRATWEVWKPLASPGLRKLIEGHLAGPPPTVLRPTVQQWKDARDLAIRGGAATP